MTAPLDAHMQAPAVLAAQDVLDGHRDGCEECRQATRVVNACELARRLHDAVVVAAQDAYRELHPDLAAGGPVDPKTLYIVGENGPEEAG